MMLVEVVEPGVDGAEAAAEALEAGGRRREGGGVAVDAEDQRSSRLSSRASV